MIRTGKVKVAAYQGMPVLPMNKTATVEKACHLIEEAGREGAELLVFPEGFIPMFPNWSMDMQIENEWSDLLTEMVLNGIEIPGEETKALGEAAKRAGVYVCMGCNEIVDNSAGTLYNSLVFLGPDGRVISHHRKLTPSHRERVLHARGNAEDLFHVVDTRIGGSEGSFATSTSNPCYNMP